MTAAIEALRAALAAGHQHATSGKPLNDYIIAACNAAPELLAEVDRLKAERDALRAVVREVVDYFDAPDEGCFSDEAMERARAALKEQA